MKVLVAACVYVLCLGAGNGSTGPPNIIVIVADDMGWNDVGYHGSNDVSTPNIDALAYNGVMLENHYTSPTCTPSRTAYLTGKYPIRMGMQGPPIAAGQLRGIPLNETLLPEYLKRLGYSTHLVGKWHVGQHTFKHTPTYRGFDSFFGYWAGYIGYFDGVHIHDKEPGKRVSGIDAHRNTEDAWQELVGKYATDVFTEEAVNIINEHHSEKPLYLQVSHLAVHAGNGGTTLEVRDKEDTLTKFDYIKDYNRRLYTGMIQALDDSVGSIVTALKTKNLLENSIILFMSDNGAPTVDPLWNTNNFGSNWPLRGLKSSLHEGGVRVPSIIYSPLIGHSNTLSYLFHVTDWLPTLYEAAGGNTQDLGKIDGVSQWETLRSGLSVTPQRTTILLDIDEILKQEALIKGAWKIIKYDTKSRNNFSTAYYGSSGRDENSPEYNITAVITSPVQLALSNDLSSNSERFLYKRKQANFDSNCKKIVDNEINEVIIPCSDYCLFNLNNDPCENTDMSNIEPTILNELVTLMANFKSVKVPANNFTSDERSHPKYFNNKWVPWLDELNSTCTGYKKNKSNWTVNGPNNIIFAVIFSIFLQRIFGNKYF